MAKTASDSYAFIVEKIRHLPVIASQDQEFWLAAIISCPETIVFSSTTSPPSDTGYLSPARLLKIYLRCLAGYQQLGPSTPPAAGFPSLRQVVAEAIEARERIFHFRASKLFRFLSEATKQHEENRTLVRQTFELAQCLAVFPCGFLRDWCSHLDSYDASPSESAALAAFHALDCQALFAALNEASAEGRKALVEGYLRYSLRLARNQINAGLEFEDLVQEASLGLVVAATKFDFLQHHRFALFATTWMWQHITRALANDSRLVRLPVHAVQKLREVQKQIRHLVVPGFPESAWDLIEGAGLDPKACMPLLDAAVLPLRIDAPGPAFSKAEAESFLYEHDQNGNRNEGFAHSAFLRLITDVLSRQQADVIRLRFGLGDDAREWTLEEIGQRYNVTRERIRQVEKKALETLSHAAHRRRLRGLKSAVLDADPADRWLHRFRPPAVSCEDALDPSHPYASDDGVRLDSMLHRAFGSRQTRVRQSITIKGQLLAVFAMSGRAMHTSRIGTILQELYPSERHQETTLYSVMAASPENFLSLGAAVFASVEVERNAIGRGHYQLPFCPGFSGDTAITTTGLSIMLHEFCTMPPTFDLRAAVIRIAEAIRGRAEPPEWYVQNLAFLSYALGFIRYAELVSHGTLLISQNGISPDVPAMVLSLVERVAGMRSFCALLQSVQPVPQAALGRQFSDLYELGQYDCPNRLGLLLQLGIAENVQGNFCLTQEGWRIIQTIEDRGQSLGANADEAPQLLDTFVAEHLATLEQREMDELFEQLTGNNL